MKVKAKKIAFYPNHSDKRLGATTTIDAFIEDIRSGRWQDNVLPVRIAKDDKAKKAAKDKLPNVTISGIFQDRDDDTLLTHSGYIAIDMDGKHGLEDPTAMRDKIAADPYVYSAFLSASAKGLCVIVKVDPKAHREAYMWMSGYFYKRYEIHTDPSCKNLSRIRYVSYDPDATLNANAIQCPAEPAPKKEQRPRKQYLFQSSDFERILKEALDNNIDLTATYNEWMLCALAFLNKFEPETARDYFHTVSSVHPDYDPSETDKKFDNLLDTNREVVTIDWFYWHVEKNGIKPYGRETEALLDFEVFKDPDERDDTISADLVQQRLEEMPMATKVKNFLKAQHKEYLQNVITEELTVDGTALNDKHLNSLYVKFRERVDDGLQFDFFKRILFSDFVRDFHPFQDFIDKYKDTPAPSGNIDKIIDALKTDTPHANIFIKKWLVAMVAHAFGHTTELILVLCGKQKTGKTWWFKLILPEELKEYRASLSWGGDKDEVIRMSRNLIMLDDEMGGKSNKEEKQIKKISSIDKEQTRGAYKSIDAKYKRLAIFCGTTNDDWFLSDSTGNRRFLPVHILSMDFELFNSVDKGELFYELYLEWKKGYDISISDEEQQILDDISAKFTKPNTEQELVAKFLNLPADSTDTVKMTATEIRGYLKRSHPYSNVNLIELGRALKKAGFESKQERVKGTNERLWLYSVVVVNNEFTEYNDEEETY